MMLEKVKIDCINEFFKKKKVGILIVIEKVE